MRCRHFFPGALDSGVDSDKRGMLRKNNYTLAVRKSRQFASATLRALYFFDGVDMRQVPRQNGNQKPDG